MDTRVVANVTTKGLRVGEHARVDGDDPEVQALIDKGYLTEVPLVDEHEYVDPMVLRGPAGAGDDVRATSSGTLDVPPDLAFGQDSGDVTGHGQAGGDGAPDSR